MNSPHLTIPQLRQSIGHPVRYQGRSWLIIEVLEQRPALVLQEAQGRSAIQSDQYGNARRFAPDTQTVAVYGPDGRELNPAFIRLAESLGQ